MKKILVIFLIQGYLMAATLFKVNVDGVEVPVIFEKDNRLPLTSVRFIFKDSGYLASNKAGLVSMSASLLNEGSKKEGAINFAKELENRAISLSVNSGKETFVFSIESLKEQFNFAVEKLIELINDPNYSKDTFKKIVKKKSCSFKEKRG
jgi:predicted Zn-dependent peptidase